MHARAHVVALVSALSVSALSVSALSVSALFLPDQVGAGPTAAARTYRPPVDAPVVDPFGSPPNRYAAGNRGLDFDTSRGQRIRAIGGGVVVFAGQVARRNFVTVRHPDGLRSSYSWLSTISVVVGEQVRTGQVVGTAGTRFQLGVRRGNDYFDPARLFARGRPRLLPTATVAASTTAPRS